VPEGTAETENDGDSCSFCRRDFRSPTPLDLLLPEAGVLTADMDNNVLHNFSSYSLLIYLRARCPVVGTKGRTGTGPKE